METCSPCVKPKSFMFQQTKRSTSALSRATFPSQAFLLSFVPYSWLNMLTGERCQSNTCVLFPQSSLRRQQTNKLLYLLAAAQMCSAGTIGNGV